MKHLLKLLDCTPEEITSILDLADQLKYERKHHISHRLLEGKSIGLIFQKSSTRTRVSFETGMFQLGVLFAQFLLLCPTTDNLQFCQTERQTFFNAAHFRRNGRKKSSKPFQIYCLYVPL